MNRPYPVVATYESADPQALERRWADVISAMDETYARQADGHGGPYRRHTEDELLAVSRLVASLNVAPETPLGLRAYAGR